jgi:hypothetical protein
MTPEIPQNEVRTVRYEVSGAELLLLIKKLYDNRDVFKIEHMRSGADFMVIVHFAIMDLPLRLSSVSASIERIVAEVKGTGVSS